MVNGTARSGSRGSEVSSGASATPTLTEVFDEKSIEPWAMENRERAIALGKRLIGAKTPEDLRGQPSLGEFEDRATAWAILNPMKAKMLVLQLYTKLKP
jgi:hypothetical protein